MNDQKPKPEASKSPQEMLVIPRVYTNDVDTFVAEDKDALREQYEATYGDEMEEMTGDPDELDNWREIHADEPLSIFWDAEREGFPERADVEEVPEDKRMMPEFTHSVTASACNWAKHVGHGFLCSTEW